MIDEVKVYIVRMDIIGVDNDDDTNIFNTHNRE